MSTSENIKRIRKEKGFTQKELGELCGMYESQIRKYELGKANPKKETLEKIAKALDVSIVELLPYENYYQSKEMIESQEVQKYLINELENTIDKKNLRHIVNVLESMGYTMTLNDDSFSLEKKDVHFSEFGVDIKFNELLDLEKESDNFLKFKIQELIYKRWKETPKIPKGIYERWDLESKIRMAFFEISEKPNITQEEIAEKYLIICDCLEKLDDDNQLKKDILNKRPDFLKPKEK